MTKKLICKDCGASFEFSEQEQKFFKEKGYTEPKRCKPCRRIRKMNELKNTKLS